MQYQHFIDAGVKIEIAAIDLTGDGYFYGRDDKLHYRWINDQLQIGVNRSFDRWANSVDFVLPRCDGERLAKIDVEQLRIHIDRQISMGRYDQRWGLEVEIRLRDMRR